MQHPESAKMGLTKTKIGLALMKVVKKTKSPIIIQPATGHSLLPMMKRMKRMKRMKTVKTEATWRKAVAWSQ